MKNEKQNRLKSFTSPYCPLQYVSKKKCIIDENDNTKLLPHYFQTHFDINFHKSTVTRLNEFINMRNNNKDI